MNRPIFLALTLSSLTLFSLGHAATVARVGNTEIGDEEMQKVLGTQIYESEKAVYDLKKRWLEAKAKEILFEQAAKERGMTKEAWYKTFIEEKSGTPSKKEVDEFLNRYPVEMRTQPDSVKKVTDYLTQQKKMAKEDEKYAELQKKNPVQISLQEPVSPYKPVSFSPDDPAMGPANAPVTLVEFTDFQCPFCQQAQETLKQVEKLYATKLRVVARQFPLPMHERAKPAAEAALCAHEQGKYWVYRDKMFGEKKLADEDFVRYAAELKLDSAKFKECLDSDRMMPRVMKDVEEGQSYGVRGTPHFFINGTALSGARPLDDFKALISAELAKKK